MFPSVLYEEFSDSCLVDVEDAYSNELPCNKFQLLYDLRILCAERERFQVDQRKLPLPLLNNRNDSIVAFLA